MSRREAQRVRDREKRGKRDISQYSKRTPLCRPPSGKFDHIPICLEILTNL